MNSPENKEIFVCRLLSPELLKDRDSGCTIVWGGGGGDGKSFEFRTRSTPGNGILSTQPKDGIFHKKSSLNHFRGPPEHGNMKIKFCIVKIGLRSRLFIAKQVLHRQNRGAEVDFSSLKQVLHRQNRPTKSIFHR